MGDVNDDEVNDRDDIDDIGDRDEIGAGPAQDDVRALLRDLMALVPEQPPEPRGALADLLAGKRVLPRQRRTRRTVAGGTALAIGVVLGSGVAAAASNHLPASAQRAAHDFARSYLPFAIPAPVADRRHQVITEPDDQHPGTLPLTADDSRQHRSGVALSLDRHGSGSQAGEDSTGTAGRHRSGESGDSEGDSGSGDRSDTGSRDGDDETTSGTDTRRTSGDSGSGDGTTRVSSSESGDTDGDSDGSTSSGSGDSGDSSTSGDSGDAGSTGSDGGDGSDGSGSVGDD